MARKQPIIADPSKLPAFLVAKALKRLSNEEARALNNPVPVLSARREPDHQLELAPEGVGYADIFMNEGGWRRFIVTERGYKHVHLLYLPTMEHVKMPAAEFADDVKSGAVKWFRLPGDLGDRIRAKCVQWAMLGKRFSYRQVNLALAALGEPLLETPEENNLPPSAPKEEGEAAPKAPAASRVTVDGIEFGSVLKAFEALNLPIPKHQKFRAELKKVGTLVFEHGKKKYEFKTGRALS